jgi:hypothetical protein
MGWEMRIHNVDNRLKVLVEGKVIWEAYYDFDPNLDIAIDLDPHLNPAPKPTTVQVMGFNGPMLSGGSNPWHFNFEFLHNGKQALSVNRRSDASGGSTEVLVLFETHVIKGDNISPI